MGHVERTRGQAVEMNLARCAHGGQNTPKNTILSAEQHGDEKEEDCTGRDANGINPEWSMSANRWQDTFGSGGTLTARTKPP